MASATKVRSQSVVTTGRVPSGPGGPGTAESKAKAKQQKGARKKKRKSTKVTGKTARHKGRGDNSSATKKGAAAFVLPKRRQGKPCRPRTAGISSLTGEGLTDEEARKQRELQARKKKTRARLKVVTRLGRGRFMLGGGLSKVWNGARVVRGIVCLCSCLCACAVLCASMCGCHICCLVLSSLCQRAQYCDML